MGMEAAEMPFESDIPHEDFSNSAPDAKKLCMIIKAILQPIHPLILFQEPLHVLLVMSF